MKHFVLDRGGEATMFDILPSHFVLDRGGEAEAAALDAAELGLHTGARPGGGHHQGQLSLPQVRHHRKPNARLRRGGGGGGGGGSLVPDRELVHIQ